jgi:hypothetical protein
MDLLNEFGGKKSHGQEIIIVIELMWIIYGIIIYLCKEKKVNNRWDC